MPKLGTFSGEEVCQILESHGFRRVRQKGSHAIMQKEMLDTTVTVPIPLHRELKIGTHYDRSGHSYQFASDG